MMSTDRTTARTRDILTAKAHYADTWLWFEEYDDEEYVIVRRTPNGVAKSKPMDAAQARAAITVWRDRGWL